jgi:EpsI family protein
LLGTDRVVQRTYRSDRGDEVLLCVVYASYGDRSIHPPEVCYRGWGFEITDRGRVEVPGSPDPDEKIEASLLDLSREGSRRVSLFWYQGSAGAGTGWLRQRIRGLLAPLRGGSSEWALIRVSSAIRAGGTRDETIDRIRDLLRDLAPYLAVPAGP